MTKEKYVVKLKEAIDVNKICVRTDEARLEKLYELSSFLIETNKTKNLTAITEETEIIVKHFLDCAAISAHIPPSSSIIDVGCGAGFPTLPLAIFRDDIKITALDSTGKKISFVNEASERLNLSNVTAVCARAEEYVANFREIFDVCTGRAVARLNVLSELCLPFVKVGGLFIAMKSNKGEEELHEALSGIRTLGAELKETKVYEMSSLGHEITREIQVYIKKNATPLQYPRKYAKILKKPL